jgi:hypothetical protein
MLLRNRLGLVRSPLFGKWYSASITSKWQMIFSAVNEESSDLLICSFHLLNENIVATW